MFKNTALFALLITGTFYSCLQNEDSPLTEYVPVPNQVSYVNSFDFLTSWTTNDTQNDFIIQIAKDLDFNILIEGYEWKIIHDNKYLVTDIDVSQALYYRVAVQANNHVGEFSNAIEIEQLDVIDITSNARLILDQNLLAIVEGDDPSNALNNTLAFNQIMDDYFYSQSPVENKNLSLYLPSGIYYFNQILLGESCENTIEGIQFFGDGRENTVIKLLDVSSISNNSSCSDSSVNTAQASIRLTNLDDFVLKNFSVDGSGSSYQGGVWVRENCSNGVIENIEVYEAYAYSMVISGQGTENVLVNQCVVKNQEWILTNTPAMFLAGENAKHITFQNCKTFSDNGHKADHFDTDNAQYVSYINCIADGTGSSGGVGFWNEGQIENEIHEAISSYVNCSAINTFGGLGISENSKVTATNFVFDNAGRQNGWTVWQKGYSEYASLNLTNSIFNNCGSVSGNRKGGIHIEGAKSYISNCRFINTPSGSYNISVYKANTVSSAADREEYLDDLLFVDNCDFDKGLIYFESLAGVQNQISIGQLRVMNSFFQDEAKLQTGRYSYFINLDVSNNTFINKGLYFFEIKNFVVSDNRFISESSSSEPAIYFDLSDTNNLSGEVKENVFKDYSTPIGYKYTSLGNSVNVHSNTFY